MEISPNKPQGLEIAIKNHLQQNQLPDFDSFLFEKIMARLGYEYQLKNLRPKLWVAFGGLLAGLVLLVVAGEAFLHTFIQTPTSHYLSLMFTDFKLIADNWQDYLLGVLENLPLGYLAVMLSSVLGGIVLVDFAAHRILNFRKTSNLLHYGSVREKLI